VGNVVGMGNVDDVVGVGNVDDLVGVGNVDDVGVLRHAANRYVANRVMGTRSFGRWGDGETTERKQGTEEQNLSSHRPCLHRAPLSV
jgi:hypothetical protein